VLFGRLLTAREVGSSVRIDGHQLPVLGGGPLDGCLAATAL
jgi:hypothetical protein